MVLKASPSQEESLMMVTEYRLFLTDSRLWCPVYGDIPAVYSVVPLVDAGGDDGFVLDFDSTYGLTAVEGFCMPTG